MVVSPAIAAGPETPPVPVRQEQKLSFPVAGTKDSDTTAVTLGVKFTAARPGRVIGVEFHRIDSQNTAREVQLWSRSGTLVASARTPSATAKGWNRAVFASPVAVRAGQTFVASYQAQRGRYTNRNDRFTAPRRTGDLSVSAGAGVYRYGSAARFPTSTFDNSDYYVTPVFLADGPSPAATSSPTGSPSTTRTTTPTTTRTTTPLATPTTVPTSSRTSTPLTTTGPVSPAPAPAPGAFPDPSTTGVPAGWTPQETRTTDLRITTAGAVVQDVRLVNADLVVDAPNVTIRRVEVQGGVIDNFPGSTCHNGLVLEDVSLVRAPGQVTSGDEPALGVGGYTARRVKIDGLPEGFRVGGARSSSNPCGPVTIENSFARVVSPDRCGDWHGDVTQGFDGGPVTVRNSTFELVMRPDCGGTAPFFYPHSQGNTSATIDGLLVKGGGYAFRLGMPATVRGLKIVDRSWVFGPIDVKCSVASTWQADIVTVDSAYRPTATVRAQPCNTELGN